MKSVKPGCGPSLMGAAGAAAAGIFGVIWIVAAVQMGAPAVFPLFGLVFIGIAVMQAVYHFKNATGKERYSVVDIVDSNAEPDPLAQRFGGEAGAPPADAGEAAGFCPYCGAEAEAGFAYCKKCGKRLP